MKISKIRTRKVVATQHVLGILALLLLASCRMVITTDATGHISSSSGLYDCEKSNCVFEIEESITEIFTAIPATGYRFVRWQGLCTLSPTAVCNASVAPLPAKHAHLDGDIPLSAEFESNSVVRPWYRDQDGDGYGATTNPITSSAWPQGYVVNDLDCDDTDASVRPWTNELEDGRDNNCNDQIDEGFVDQLFYLDSDSDGYGDPDVSIMARRKPEGYVTNAMDCNDYSVEDNPDALERLDSRDNNCDGQIDENAVTYFRDIDGDGFGSSNASIESIEPIAGYVLDPGDCDDNNISIFPGATEEFDSVDNDCDSLVDEGFSPSTYYRDADSDGHGDSAVSILAIAPPSGYVLNSSDNCPEHYNPDQTDSDNDGAGNACDPVDDRIPDENTDPLDDPDPAEDTDPADAPDNEDIDDSNDHSASGSCTVSPQAQSMLDAVNSFRAGNRDCGSSGVFNAVPALSWSCTLENAALVHSADMANNDFFSHTGSDGSSAGDRATRTGYSWSAWGENIAAGGSYDSVAAVLQGWIDSPGHCANLMNSSFTELGASRYSNTSSRYGNYWTQVFGRPR